MKTRCAGSVGLLSALLIGGSALADQGSFWTISASAPGLGASNWFVPSSVMSGEGAYTLHLGAYGTVTIGSRLTAGRGGDGCPEINLNFAVLSAAMVPLNFSITSAPLAFPPTGNTFGRLTGDLKVTDADGSGSGMVTGGLSNSSGLGAFINGGVAAGTLISSAFPSLVAPGEGMNTDMFDSGCITLDGVMDMQVQWNFSLSAGDSSEGDATFLVCEDCAQVVPLPSAAGLGLAGFGAVASRRRRAI